MLTLSGADVLSVFLSLLFSSVAVCRFTNTGDDWYVLVGVGRDMILNPRSVGGGFIYTYRLIGGGEKLEFVHKVGYTVKIFIQNRSLLPDSLIHIPIETKINLLLMVLVKGFAAAVSVFKHCVDSVTPVNVFFFERK